MALQTAVPTHVLAGRLEAAIPGLLEQSHVPGAAVILLRDGTVAWERAFGWARTNPCTPMTLGSRFQAASLGKPVFACAVLRLAQRGIIDLSAPLTTYLPEPYVPDDPQLDGITARSVLGHTTGWPNWRPEGRPLVRREAANERFGYSGEGYMYLQRVIEALVGAPLEEIMQAEVLGPLSMALSSYIWAAAGAPTLAASHDRSGQQCAPGIGDGPMAAASLHTSARDLAHFVSALLSPSAGCLSSEIVNQMLTPHVALNKSVSWGLGWGLQQTSDGRAFWHWGDNRGYKHFVLAYPEARMGLILLTNGESGLALVAPIFATALGGELPALAWLAEFYGGRLPGGAACTDH
jgi:CubicO group peptidase (beta-lactamase class C family)